MRRLPVWRAAAFHVVAAGNECKGLCLIGLFCPTFSRFGNATPSLIVVLDM